MWKFTKLLENSLEIIYNIFNGTLGKLVYNKELDKLTYIDREGNASKAELSLKNAFIKMQEEGYPDEYTYAYC